MELMQEYLNTGFGDLFTDVRSAEAHLGTRVHPAPLGTISKQKSDGTWKHRVTQDQRRNSVNSATTVPERQVLPRPVDHAVDLATVAATTSSSQSAKVLIWDFKYAFVALPLRDQERAFNVTVLEEELRRARPPLWPQETPTGKVVVWRVLGFGGKPSSKLCSTICPGTSHNYTPRASSHAIATIRG
jgi:hypothetical protein